MANRDIVVIGASAGGIETLQAVLPDLPSDLRAAVFIVVHIPPEGGWALARILARATSLEVKTATDGESIERGTIYVARGNFHLLVGNGHVHVRQGPRENGHRPAADPLFRSAAAYYGPRVIGVVLSGSLSDGSAGLFAIRRQGGLAIVQDPADAIYDGMPSSALEYVGADQVAPAAKLGALIGRLVSEEVTVSMPENPPPLLQKEVALMESGDEVLEGNHPGRPSPWPCPECSGVLWEIDDGPVLRFRCRVGHAWTADSLLDQQGEDVEGAMWMALRALEDRAALSRSLADRAELSGRRHSAKRYREELVGMDRNILILRRLLSGSEDQEDVQGAEGNHG